MDGLMPVLKQFVVSGLIAQATRRNWRDYLGGIGIIVFAGVMIFVALIFGALALYEELAGIYGSPAAYAVIAAIAAGVSAVLFFSGRRLMNKQDKKTASHSEAEITRIMDIVIEELPKELAAPVRDNPKLSVAAAALAGLLLGGRLN